MYTECVKTFDLVNDCGVLNSLPLCMQWNDRFIFLIMEYCDGGDLSHFIKSNRVLKEWSARKFLRQIGKD